MQRKTLHAIHSPFIFDFTKDVLNDKTQYPAYKSILKARKAMLSNNNLIETVDFGTGAGNKDFQTYRIKIAELSKRRMHPFKYNKLLYRIVQHLRPKTILEFGTSTGASTISLALGNSKAKVVSMEGCASISYFAQSTFDRMQLSNIELVIGNFNTILPPTLSTIDQLDLVYIDGNHRKIPTLNYFDQCLTKITPDSIIILDDIHISDGMEEAWETIKKKKEVTITIDLFQFGIVFFRKGIEKQHFVLSIS